MDIDYMLAHGNEDEILKLNETFFANEIGKMIHQAVKDSVQLGDADIPTLISWLNKCSSELSVGAADGCA
jgi:hypothetical protein